MNIIELLDRLVGFPTISRDSNLELIRFARDYLDQHGIESTLIHDETGQKANLYATIGPKGQAGVMLSGHTDVVPVEGQEWSSDPFRLRRLEGRLHGRGTADMKGFLACALVAAGRAAQRSLVTPVHLAFSYDEEIGCVGVRRMIDVLEQSPIRPRFCIVGEPTSMAVATGHKGKTALRAVCIGREGHSALAPRAVNAIHLASDFVTEIRRLQEELATDGVQDGDYDVPYTTLHVGRIAGGVALNIVPNRCELEFEIRNLAEDDPAALLAKLARSAEAIVTSARDRAPEADIRIETTNSYPGLATRADAEVVGFVKSLTGANDTIKVAFGTEGGLLAERLSVPTVVCGPGSMEQGHKPDEFITEEQLFRCDEMLSALIRRLEAGL